MNPEKKQKNILSKKKTAYILAFISMVIVVILVSLAITYKNSDQPRSFSKSIFEAFSLKKEPFLERESFFYPPAAESEKADSALEEPEVKQVLDESGSMKKSTSDVWWLNSGGIMLIGEKEFSTNLGSLSRNSNWQKLYAKTNPRDTDEGYYPQNIFRLVTRFKWKTYAQQVYFNISKINLSDSEYRNESNGILLFNRYQDGDNLYYTGLRVDGHAVIKKKIKDKYYTLAEKQIFDNGKKYDIKVNPCLIPTDSWIGIKSEVENIDSETVRIRLYVDKERNGNWQLVLETSDSGNKFGKKPFLKKGYAGIRTDFMDVRFENYSIHKL